MALRKYNTFSPGTIFLRSGYDNQFGSYFLTQPRMPKTSSSLTGRPMKPTRNRRVFSKQESMRALRAVPVFITSTLKLNVSQDCNSRRLQATSSSKESLKSSFFKGSEKEQVHPTIF